MVTAAKDSGQPLRMPDYLTTIEVEPVGRFFLSHWDRLSHGRGLSVGQDSASESESEESEGELCFEDDLTFLRSLDPKRCKDQDHYRVLGLGELRHRATDDQIKKAYRFKVLRHHPDKRDGGVCEDDDYFTCITKAFEVLGVPSKRRAYDSVDPAFDDDVPPETKHRFYETFGPAFERNARWSTRHPVPNIGGDPSPKPVVEKFYKFWYDFESWREYSYLDEEDKEKGSDRDERRWIEKNNRVQRAERKKEEMKRVRRLVDNAYNSDPRIVRFKEAERQERLDRKKAKQEAVKAKRDEEERLRLEAEMAEKKAQEEKEMKAKAKADAARKEKEALKKAIKAERKQLRTLCKETGYFASDDTEKVSHMGEVDKLCELLDLAGLQELNGRLAEDGKEAFVVAFRELNERLETEKRQQVETAQKGTAGTSCSTSTKGNWTTDELQLLVKAVNLFPAGTVQRWEVVAGFINQHTKTPEVQRAAKETLAKAKEMQSGDFHLSCLKEEANRKAYENLERQKKRDVRMDDQEASTRTETAAEAQGLNVTAWTAEEQKLLEQALKTYPASLGPSRWDSISDCLPNRSKKDCMKRYKELAELVRAKKAASAAAAAAAKR